MKKYFIIILCLIISILFAFFTYSYIKKTFVSKAKDKEVVPNVTVQTVKEESVVRSYEALGRVVSKYQVSIVARVSGYLQKSFFNEGSYVKAGDTLFLIEPEDMRANKDDMMLRLKGANSSYTDKKSNHNHTHIKAPVDGRIGTIDVSVGNYVSPSTGSLTTINSTNPIYITFPLSSENYDSLISIGKNDAKRKVEIYLNNGEKYKYAGIQDFANNEADKTTGNVTLRATVQNPENRLLHGQTVKVKIFASSSVNVPIVPITSVMENQEGKYVYVLGSDNLPHLTYIKVDAKAGYNWLVKSGIKAGDVIIKDGVTKVSPNKPVNIVNN